ncbi:MAG: [protein-PII] uridylyltransferase [Nitratireductor sp.]|nr:[protein-PII] uridylyltransferase [Nitratireductor sp.]
MAKPLNPRPLVTLTRLHAEVEAIATASPKSAADPATRAQILKHLKQVNRDGRERAEELLLGDGDGTLCAKRIANLQDTLVKAIYRFACDHVYRNDNRSSGERLTIAAVGGYGRGTLAPGSDIDLLFILPFKQTAWCEQVVEYVLYFLWDMGFKVGHATRNLDECMRQARADMTIRTSILEARFIDGDEELFAELEKRFRKEIVARTTKQFIDAKLAERDQRHKKAGESRYRVEPNIKDGKGGLRDLHTLYWIGKYYYKVERPSELVSAGLFSEDEYQRFKRAERFLWTVRCHMHFMTGRAEERLSFDLQRDLATRLKYISHGGLLEVERFMKHYFLIAKEVGDLTLIVCAELEEEQAKSVTGINGLIRSIRFPVRKIAGSKDFVDDHGRINVADEKVFERDPVNLLRLFKFADDNNLDIHPDARHLIANSLRLVDRALRADEEANRLFLAIITSRNGPEVLLRKMNETGLLGRFIPPFGKIVAMMQFNMYHHYTVDEHLIRAVGVLSAIERNIIGQDHPLSSRLLPDIEDREALYLAVLIHDIAKGRREDHSVAGARVARSLCPRLGFSRERTELVSWLVQEHLTMSMTAQSRDLSDRKTIETFAATVQSIERLRYLVVLTVCDIRAVGPGVWNGWKGQLLRTLYHATVPLLTGGFTEIDQGGAVGQARAELSAALQDWEPGELKTILDLHYDPYFLSTPFENQIRHMTLLRDVQRKGERLATMVHTKEFEAITEINVLSPDHPKLLSILAGSCAAAGANIVDAKIHTTRDGRALDTIFINREFDDEREELARAERVSALIRDALTGKVRLGELLEKQPRPKRSAKAFSVQPEVSINNNLSNHFTVIEVKCLDRPGVLSDIAFAISELSLDIASAQIATFGEKVIDSFYVTDLVGDKITLESRQRRIIDTLTTAIKSGTARI